MRLHTTKTTTARQAWPPRPPNRYQELSRSPRSRAESTATLTHTTWDNPGCLPHQAPHRVSGISPVELLDKDK